MAGFWYPFWQDYMGFLDSVIIPFITTSIFGFKIPLMVSTGKGYLLRAILPFWEIGQMA